MDLTQLLLPGLLLVTSAAQAQTTFSIGPTLGGNLATLHSPVAYIHHRLDWLAGAQALVGWGKFAVQPALLFSQKGYKDEYDIDYRDATSMSFGSATISNNVQLSYLTLPVNFSFAPLGPKAGPQLFAGPYVSLLLSGRNVHTDFNNLPTEATVTDHLTILETAEANGQYGVRRFDAGLQGGVGYRYEAFLLQASYSLGLRTIVPAYTYQGMPVTSYNNYNRAFQLALTYLLGDAK